MSIAAPPSRLVPVYPSKHEPTTSVEAAVSGADSDVPTLRVSARGSVAPGVAWERYADPARWPRWAPQIRRVETAGDRIGPGLRGRVVGPLGVAVSFVIDDVDEVARTWSWSV